MESRTDLSRQRKNILFVTQFFYPDLQATSQLFLELCEDLAKEFKIRVICGKPLIRLEGEGQKVAVKRREICNGVDITRIFYICKPDRRTNFCRGVNHVTFTVSAFLHLLFVRKPDIFIFTTDNPLNFIYAILFRKTPKIYLCQDLYLEQGLRVGVFTKGKLLTRLIGFFQRAPLRYADKIIVIGVKMKKYLEEIIKVPSSKIEVIYNWADTDKIIPGDQNNPFSRKYGLVDKFVVMHSGRIGVTQDLGLLLEAAQYFSDVPDIKFVIIGEGAKKDELLDLAKEKKVENVLFLPFQPQEIFKHALVSASLQVILLKRDLLHCLVPSRLYTAMASARPLAISTQEGSEVYDIVTRAHCGIPLELGDLEELKSTIYKLYNERDQIRVLGNKGRECVTKHFSRPLMTDKYKRIIREMLNSKNNSRERSIKDA
ncbi:MAG: glycosyltransferase family 4 protein [Candidatus Omnitrophota bacterium]|nr:MAG: glycosyltransferase family 4 protein [Candidatus Omnitrophota bacterium]